jgi:hypothetical protein
MFWCDLRVVMNLIIDFFAHVLYKWSLNYKELIMKNEIIVSFDKQNLNDIKMHWKISIFQKVNNNWSAKNEKGVRVLL